MKYKDAVKQSMEYISAIPKSIFVGYNLKYASKAYGTMADIDPKKIIEMPLSEQLMTGLATGLALNNFLPILIFERHDFLLLASDQIINHLIKMEHMTKGDFKPKVIIRAIVGGTKPFHPGDQHIQEFTNIFRGYPNLAIFEPKTAKEVIQDYETAIKLNTSSFISEPKDIYND